MDIEQIEENLNHLVNDFSEKTFIYDLLLAYGIPKNTINLSIKGKRNISRRDDQVIIKKKLFFQKTSSKALHVVFNNLRNDEKAHVSDPRFIVVTDYKTLLAEDEKTKETLDIDITTINEHSKFFEPLAPDSVFKRKIDEKPVDIKVANEMAKLYGQLSKDNHIRNHEDKNRLNIFLSRLIYCFFAEDTGIFNKATFTDLIRSYTKQDGSDLDKCLLKLFKVLNAKKNDRGVTPEYLKIFPYVNGKLFEYMDYVPKFTSITRRMILDSGDINWSRIDLDIFGSIMQNIVSWDRRGKMGIHYTSLENIEKLIRPLFVDELWKELNDGDNDQNKLYELLSRLKRLRIFDPACGSGNFLVVTYTRICEIEREIILRLMKIYPNMSLPLSEISLSQFYGIEIDNFAFEMANLSLWLAEHQMNIIFKQQFGKARPLLPLKKRHRIVLGNALSLDWGQVCPKEKDTEIYILGNPPYLGSRLQGKEQKKDVESLFGRSSKLDYVSCWFIKGAQYIENTKSQLAFISTSSICRGEQVALVAKNIFKKY